MILKNCKNSLFFIGMLFLTGCATDPCDLAIQNLQEPHKIPKTANIEIGDTIQADDGGHELLKNYVVLSMQTNSVIQSCADVRADVP